MCLRRIRDKDWGERELGQCHRVRQSSCKSNTESVKRKQEIKYDIGFGSYFGKMSKEVGKDVKFWNDRPF